jgi:hypothetical protein
MVGEHRMNCLDQYMGKCRAFVNTVMKVLVSINMGKILTSRGALRF